MSIPVLNDRQQEAVFATEGPLLVLAGAGSGKTRVLTHRIAHLIEDEGVNPWNILAITFTNKAAGEMRERVNNLVGFGAEEVWVSTFHATCSKILRRYIDRIGYERDFTIYDSDDQKTLMKEVCRELQIDTQNLKERAILSVISDAKNQLIGPKTFAKQHMYEFEMKRYVDAYQLYQDKLKKNNALDFDDLIFRAVDLLKQEPEVLTGYQNRFRYIMVDEYQDTNAAQFELVRLLADKYRNLCVVGDDDQSIYKFRGADIRNILEFERSFPGAMVVKLEQNYRSTGNILEAANSVIRNNRGRKEKKLWTDKGDGDLIHFIQARDAYQEAELIARQIEGTVRRGDYRYQDIACLYRTNAQSRTLEEKFISHNIPYKIFGGVNFYSRREVKDVLAYLKTVENGRDDVAVKRIINVPRRSIGQTTIERVQVFADEQGIGFFDALTRADEIGGLTRAKKKITEFANWVLEEREKIGSCTLAELTKDILESSGYLKDLEAEGKEEAEARKENIGELINKMADYEETAEDPTLVGFLEEVALIADIDNLESGADYVVLMTIHSAKGLEFPKVYLTGMEEGLFPSYQSIMSEDEDADEEERRLCYVAITRAMEELTLTAAEMRTMHGQTHFNDLSRFYKEIPRRLIQEDFAGRRDGYAYNFGGDTEGYGRSSFSGKQAGSADSQDEYSGSTFGRRKSGNDVSDEYSGSTFGRRKSGDDVSDEYSGSTFGRKKTGQEFTGDSYRESSQGKSNPRLSQNRDEYPSRPVKKEKPERKEWTKIDSYEKRVSYSATGRSEFGNPKNLPPTVTKGGAPKAGSLEYGVGDTVSHVKFGRGTVLSIEDAGRDYVVMVEFEQAGTKRMMAGFAKLKKV
ncbi:MAG: UvrD-helicase domain-containing protein [Lachnospiraceae bacterium]|nr:UvrD-helicase domain-containing protein [Lachnospiraceae bacterium]